MGRMEFCDPKSQQSAAALELGEYPIKLDTLFYHGHFRGSFSYEDVVGGLMNNILSKTCGSKRSSIPYTRPSFFITEEMPKSHPLFNSFNKITLFTADIHNRIERSQPLSLLN
ncbi:hypothetical protein FRC03_007566 [Tulasnella sp. 419]|nr:hypothetical protein FRC03_007566 [Tulasnella sp. 419]